MISFLIAALMALAAVVALAAIHHSVRKGFAAARLIGRQLAALETHAPTAPRTRPVRATASRRPARRVAPALRAAA